MNHPPRGGAPLTRRNHPHMIEPDGRSLRIRVIAVFSLNAGQFMQQLTGCADLFPLFKEAHNAPPIGWLAGWVPAMPVGQAATFGFAGVRFEDRFGVGRGKPWGREDRLFPLSRGRAGRALNGRRWGAWRAGNGDRGSRIGVRSRPL